MVLGRTKRVLGRKDDPPFFFSPQEYVTLTAFAACIIPSGATPARDPGAREVGTVNYVDSWILDESEPTKRRFREALAYVNEKCREMFGVSFAKLEPVRQDEFLHRMVSDKEGRRFFDLVRAACLDGFYSDYCDPDYHGRTAWPLVGFEGKRISDVRKDWSFLRIYREKLERDVSLGR